MLARQLEPEVMDSAADAAEYDAMDFADVNGAFAREALAVLPPTGPVLDLGTGTARIPVLMAQQAAGHRYVAVDLSREMIALGRHHVAAAGLGARITLVVADAKALPYPGGAFAGVISNSILHHIPEPAAVMREVARLLAPGGALFLRDLLRPLDEPTWAHLVQTYAGDCNDHQRKLFADSLRAALTLDEVAALVRDAGLIGCQVAQTSDRHWTLSRAAR